MKHVKSVFLAMVLILPSSLYPALTIAADSQDHKKEETIKPMPQKWCNLWPAGIPFLKIGLKCVEVIEYKFNILTSNHISYDRQAFFIFAINKA